MVRKREAYHITGHHRLRELKALLEKPSLEKEVDNYKIVLILLIVMSAIAWIVTALVLLRVVLERKFA